jgi:WD40 repeat protein
VILVATELRSPYKGLSPFEDSEPDALLFFGRERETEIVVSNLLASRLTVLHGPSGVGKSSILRAAVVRRLRELEPDAEVFLLDDWTDEPVLPDVTGEAFLVLDQFEEYFLYHADVAPLAAALAASRAHVLIALREDQLAQLDSFQARIPAVLANRLRLGHLDRSAARAAILGPLDRWNAVVAEDARVGIEGALVEEVLDQVATAPDRIEAPYLQLVLERLWDEERASGSRLLRSATLERLGGAEAIVGAHLERALAALPPRDAEIATNALRFLVTPSRTKIAHTLDDLVGYTNESPVVLQRVLERLATQRVLRAGDGGRYEIFHDVLAEPVLAWRLASEARAALAAAHRRHRRLGVLACASLLLAAAMVALTVYAFSQRSEASKQRRVALAQRELALGQKRRAQEQTKKATRLSAVELAQKHAAEAARATAIASAKRATASEQRARASAERARASEQRAQESEGRAQTSEHAAQVDLVQARRSKRLAQHEERLARRQARIATVGKLVETAEADLSTDPVASVRAAVRAAGFERSPRVEDALRDALLALRVRGIFSGGGGAVTSAALSPDGRLVVVGAHGGGVRIYDARTHVLVHRLDAGAAVNVVRFSPDGARLAVGDAKGALLYSVGRRALRRLATGSPVLDAAFAGDGRYLVTGSADMATRIWDGTSGAALATIPATAAQEQLAVSPDGTLVAVLSSGQAIARVFSVPSGTPVGQVQQPGAVTTLAFSPDGRLLVTAGRRNGFVWDTHTWAPVRELVGHGAPITDIAFFPDGDVVTSSVDSSARVWNPTTGESIFSLAGQHQQKVLAVAVSPMGNQVATASADNTVRLWREPLGSTPALLGGHTDSVVGETFNADGTLLLTASADGTARLWDTTLPQLTPIGSQAGAITGVAVSPDGSVVLSGGADGTARLWRRSRATTLRHGGKVVRAVFAAGGREVLTAGDDGTAKRWRVADGALLATYAHGAPVRAALPLGGGVVTAGGDGVVKAWSAAGTIRWSGAQGSPITAAAVSSQGVVATGAADGTIRLWRDGRSLHTLHAHSGAVTTLAFDSSGARLASGGEDSVAYVWRVADGRKLDSLVGHRLGITSVSFSPDGSLVLTAGEDGDARVWRAADGRQLRRLKFHVSVVSQASFSPDGRWVVTAGPTTAAIWQVRTGRLVYYLNGAKGNLTAGIWAPGSLRIVTGDTGGQVETFTCGVCARTPALLATAKARLAGLR